MTPDEWPLSVRSTAIIAAFLVFSAASAALGVAEISTSREASEADAASTAVAQAQAQWKTEQEATEQAACLSQTQRNATAVSLDAVNLTAAAAGMVDPAILAALDSARTSLNDAVVGTERDPIVAKMNDVSTCEVDVVNQILTHADLTRQNSPHAAADTVTALNTARDALASALEQHAALADAARAVADGITHIDAANNDGYLASIAAADAPRASSYSNSSDSGSSSSNATGSSTGGNTSGSTGSTNGTSTSAAPAGSSSSSSGTTETGSSPSDAGRGRGDRRELRRQRLPGDYGPINFGIFTAGSVVRAATSLIGGGSVGWSVAASVQYYACY